MEKLEPRMVLAAQPIITEFMASNDSTLYDGYGIPSDWIELFNAGDQPVDLAGYALTDNAQDLQKWTFPSATLAPGQYLVVFASGNGVADNQGNLHANFALAAGGEYLALSDPQGVVLSEYGSGGANYPPQSSDVSYGLAFSTTTTEAVGPSSAVRYRIPTNSSVDATWTASGFDDATWSAGTASIGYETSGTDFAALIQTTVPAGTTSVYVRIPFHVATAGSTISTLQMKYDDGFVAYLNGAPIASANAPAAPAWNSVATTTHPDSAAVAYVDFDVSGYSHLLQTGTNTLAIHLLNAGSSSSDLLLVPRLTVQSGTPIEPELVGRMISPTPGAPNTQVQANLVAFSRPGGAFSGPFQLTLSTPDPTETIRYTLDGSTPTATSPLYAGPLTISATTRVHARAFGPLGQVGPVKSEAYTFASASVSSFTSDLPIIVLENFAAGTPGNDFQDAWMSLYDVSSTTGRSSLADLASFSSFIGQHVRGSSTAGQPKTNLRIELRDGLRNDLAASLLGMPEEADWVLYAPYNFDRAMIRNTTFYELFRQMGRYAARTRYVEVYANFNGGTLDGADYMGVYVLMENVKRDPNRVDVDKLYPLQTAEVDLTGGYILKLDRSDGEPDASWKTSRGIPTLSGSLLVHVEPERAEMSLAQRDYIRGYVQAFEDALYGPNSTDPLLGYEAFLDVDPTIDHHIMRVFSKDPDGLRLSTFLVKDRGGKLSFGPVWDFDRAAGADDDARAADPTGWPMPDVSWFESDWWGQLFDDPDFTQRWVDRWQELRRGVLSDANILATVAAEAAPLVEAQARNFARWPTSAPNGGAYADSGLSGWLAEISHFGNWLVARAQWIDEQLIARPGMSPAAGVVSPGTVVTLTATPGAAVYYTLDGSDPRADGGAVSSAAILYTGPFSVAQTTTVTARSLGTPPPQSASRYPAAESPSRAVDGNSATKYLNYGKEGSGLIVTPASGPAIVRSFILTTANDVSARDPASYQIYGTNDPIASKDNSTGLAENWTLVSSGTLNLPEARRTNGPVVSFANSTSYSSYKIVFPTVKNSASANSLQFADVQMHQTLNGTGLGVLGASDQVRAINVASPDVNFGVSAWSERTAGQFAIEVPASAANLRITEIHYHPADPTPAELALAPGIVDNDFEFVELRNISAEAISLSGVRFTEGIGFDFTLGGVAVLQPGQSVLIVGNPAAFAARYGTDLSIAGQFTGRLDNSGERLKLVDANDQVIHDFVYDDAPPWPTAPDGDGPSLEVVSVWGNYGQGANWRASAVLHGSPGAQPWRPGDMTDDGAVDGVDFLAWQRGFGTVYVPADLYEWKATYGTETASQSAVAAIAAPAAIDESALAAAARLPTTTAERRPAAVWAWLADAGLTASSPDRVAGPGEPARSPRSTDAGEAAVARLHDDVLAREPFARRSSAWAEKLAQALGEEESPHGEDRFLADAVGSLLTSKKMSRILRRGATPLA
ncbi:MAG: CotH kinase family protein [Pirellulales bacterium]|nr:CotH kinase family protein [Pirellulales bacterium]